MPLGVLKRSCFLSSIFCYCSAGQPLGPGGAAHEILSRGNTAHVLEVRSPAPSHCHHAAPDSSASPCGATDHLRGRSRTQARSAQGRRVRRPAGRCVRVGAGVPVRHARADRARRTRTGLSPRKLSSRAPLGSSPPAASVRRFPISARTSSPSAATTASTSRRAPAHAGWTRSTPTTRCSSPSRRPR